VRNDGNRSDKSLRDRIRNESSAAGQDEVVSSGFEITLGLQVGNLIAPGLEQVAGKAAIRRPPASNTRTSLRALLMTTFAAAGWAGATLRSFFPPGHLGTFRDT
jgi:hypothetical protein